MARKLSPAVMNTARSAGLCGLILVAEKPREYYLRSLKGHTFGPFNATEARAFVYGYARGQHAHAPDCDCGRLACSRQGGY